MKKIFIETIKTIKFIFRKDPDKIIIRNKYNRILDRYIKNN